MFGFIKKVNLTINDVDKTRHSLLFRVLVAEFTILAVQLNE